MAAAVQTLIEHDTAGSPVDAEVRWTNRSPADLAEELAAQGFTIGVDALRRVLFNELGLSRRQAVKDETACRFPQRDEQFAYIAHERADYERRGWPIVSIDTKKKELLGNFFRPGRALTDGQVRVAEHDFVTADERLVPYGVFDVVRNEALVYLSRGADTCELACDALRRWWQRLGKQHYRYASQLLVLCDCGGSNGHRQQRFKQELCGLARDLEMNVQVAHYPPGCSKYNPIEHRLFCHITRAWRAVVLQTIDVAKHYLNRVTTTQGLRVVAEIARRTYEKGLKATPAFLSRNPIRFDDFLPELNYTAPWFTFP